MNKRTYERTNRRTERRKLYTPGHKCREYNKTTKKHPCSHLNQSIFFTHCNQSNLKPMSKQNGIYTKLYLQLMRVFSVLFVHFKLVKLVKICIVIQREISSRLSHLNIQILFEYPYEYSNVNFGIRSHPYII